MIRTVHVSGKDGVRVSCIKVHCKGNDLTWDKGMDNVHALCIKGS
jgi:hypothetical protein